MYKSKNSAHAYYWAGLMKDIGKFKGWTPEAAHDWVKVTWGIKTTSGFTQEQNIDLIKTVKAHVEKYWNLKIKDPRAREAFPSNDSEWQAFCDSLWADTL